MLTDKTIDILREKAAAYNIEKLFLFGSCLEKPEAEAGDIDLAVEGIDGDIFFTFYADLLFDRGISKDIDLIDMSWDVPIVYAIQEEGVVIYERDS